MRRISIIFLVLLCQLVYGQDSLRQKRLKPLVIAGAATYAVSLVALDRMWYADFERQSFQFFNDNSEWQQLDKMGHFFSSFHISKVSHRGLKWAGVSEKKAILYGSLVSAIVLTPIEILDGFSAEYGASAGDLIANTSGAIFFASQQLLWQEVRVHVKYSFNRSDYAPLRPELLGNSLAEEIVKDYNAHTHWLSIDLSKFHHAIPRWLNIAIGYGGTGMVYATEQQNISNGYRPLRRWYIGMDLDLNEYKTTSRVLNTALYLINMIRIPAPAFEYSDGNFRFHTFSY